MNTHKNTLVRDRQNTTDSIGFINYCYSMGWADMLAIDCLE